MGSSGRGGLELLADVFGAKMKDATSIPTKNVCGKALLGLQSRSVLEKQTQGPPDLNNLLGKPP